MPREQILRRAAARRDGRRAAGRRARRASQVGGHDHPHVDLPTPQEVLDGLALPSGGWEVLLTDVHEQSHTRADGELAVHTNATVKLRRLR